MRSSETSTTTTPSGSDVVGTAPGVPRGSFFRCVGAVYGKDVRIEFRSGEILWTVSFFAATVVLVCAFAFLKGGDAEREYAPGVIWVALALAGALGLSRAFERERESDTMRALLLSPAPRTAVFLGKALAAATLIGLVAIVVTPLGVFFFDANLFHHPVPLAVALVLGTIGIALVGSVFAALLLRTRARDVLFPIVLYPLLIPLLLAGSQATAYIQIGDLATAWRFILFLLAYDALFLIAALWTFDLMVVE